MNCLCPCFVKYFIAEPAHHISPTDFENSTKEIRNLQVEDVSYDPSGSPDRMQLMLRSRDGRKVTVPQHWMA